MSLLTKCEQCHKVIKVSMKTITGITNCGELCFFCSSNCKAAEQQSKRHNVVKSCQVKVYLFENKITKNLYPISLEKGFILTIAKEYNGRKIDSELKIGKFTEIDFDFKSFEKALLFLEVCKKVPGVEAEFISLESC